MDRPVVVVPNKRWGETEKTMMDDDLYSVESISGTVLVLVTYSTVDVIKPYLMHAWIYVSI